MHNYRLINGNYAVSELVGGMILVVIAVASISTTKFGSINDLTATIVVAG